MNEAVIVSTARTGLAKSMRGGFNITHGAVMGGVLDGSGAKSQIEQPQVVRQGDDNGPNAVTFRSQFADGDGRQQDAGENTDEDSRPAPYHAAEETPPAFHG